MVQTIIVIIIAAVAVILSGRRVYSMISAKKNKGACCDCSSKDCGTSCD